MKRVISCLCASSCLRKLTRFSSQTMQRLMRRKTAQRAVQAWARWIRKCHLNVLCGIAIQALCHLRRTMALCLLSFCAMERQCYNGLIYSPTHSGFPTLTFPPAFCSYLHPFQSTNIRFFGCERWIIMKVDRKTSPFVRIALTGQFFVIFSIFPLQLVTAFPQASIGKGFLLSMQRT